MPRQGNVLDEKKFIGAPIERAHLLKGFNDRKTPQKWIKFFRACVIQREIAEKKKKQKQKIYNIIFAILAIPLALLSTYKGFFLVFLAPVLVTFFIINSNINKSFKKNYSEGFDFFADYFSAFFTLIEEDLIPQSRIALEANLKNTYTNEFLTEEKDASKQIGVINSPRRKFKFYEKVISSGVCKFNDESVISFQFTEKARERITRKRGSSSGKMKTKYKYKTAYPFVLKMKIPKSKYTVKPEVNKEDVNLKEDATHYILKVRRKFDPKRENPKKYNPYRKDGITTFAVDYFCLELINLINTCYSCVKPKA